ncbi:MAG: PorT family protein [Acidobacteria bacterium]|nr:PorT family protein [Acidobacteriota bacterium]
MVKRGRPTATAERLGDLIRRRLIGEVQPVVPSGVLIRRENSKSFLARRFCVVALLLITSSRLGIGQRLEAGVKVGANAARLPALETHEGPGGAEVDSGLRLGLLAGAFVAANLNRYLAIQPEALFSRKGTRLEGHTEDPFPVEASVRLDYIEVPVLVRLSISRRPRAAYLIAGPAVGFSVGTDVRVQISARSLPERDISEEIKNTEVSFVLGGGVQLRHLLVEGRYTQGLTKIRDQSPGQKAARNMALSLIAGFRF